MTTARLMLLAVCASHVSAATVTIRRDGVFLHDGSPMFPIGFTTAPPPDAKTPWGTSGYAELKSSGAAFHRCSGGQPWGAAAEQQLDRIMDASAKAGLLCAIYIPELLVLGPGDADKEKELRRVIAKYKRHPALGYWKGADEPEWGKVPVEKVQRFYDVVHELDSAHPVWITQAPRGTIESLKHYDPAYDVGAIDIYPVSYPPGLHSHLPNKNISVVGDYAKWMQEITGGRKPFWMVLQICFSGVTNPGRTLRFPTFPELRYMSWQSIINGARGLLYFGGNVPACMADEDRALGWNWRFYRRVLKPVLEEFSPGGPAHAALIAPDSSLPIQAAGDAVEFRVRESGNEIFLLAARREGPAVQVSFRGLPENIPSGDLLFEEPRKVKVEAGGFTDWFGPNEVHIYRFRR
ncbi:MAG TPA: hypothetical protein VFL57_15675 [Bryobacteraceae bacterium]|nr:hypothetical protein [Bryobacteraceae bacterium]